MRRELVHVVRDDDAGDAQRFVHLLDEPADHAHGNRIETHERLVVDQDVRIHDDGARERHAPRHAAGQFRRHEPRGATQSDRVQLGQHELAHQRLGQLGVRAHRKRDVFVDVFVGEQRAVLEQHAHAPAQREQFARDIVETSSPNTRTLPRSACTCPVMSRSSVVLPVPDGPMNAVIRPRRAVMFRPSKIARPPTA